MMTTDNDPHKIALKLHKQFAHPSVEKLTKLLRNANILNKELENEIKSVSEKCEICCKFKKPQPRPVVGMPLSSKFNEAVSMDLKVWRQNSYFLVVVDLATRYCSATLITNKQPKTILNALFLCWVSKFGAPNKIISDNGCEFNNSEMRQFGETFNVKIMTTAAESPWSNGVCERLNAVLGGMVTKIVNDTSCDVSIGLAWAVSARNALNNFSGFSPNQLVFGFNPALPDVFTSQLPALEEVSASKIVRDNLNALHIARQEFIKVESSERVRRALRHNVRASDVENLVNGDSVFYKRNDSKEWRGPGIVIGKDGKQVLVKHGGTYVRVHTCRISRTPNQTLRNEVDSHIEDVAPENTIPQENHNHEEVEEPSDVDEVPVCCDEEVTAEEYSHQPTSDSVDLGHNVHSACAEVSSSAVSRVSVGSRPKVKVGQRIQGLDTSSGEIISGKIISRAGKSGGKYKNCFNIKNDSDGNIDWYNLDNLSELKTVPDDVEMFIMFSSEEVIAAKNKEIENWRENDVYEEVEDRGQESMSVRWVITEKVKSNKTVVKARLVARGFEEESINLKKDSPTCSKEAVRLAISLATSNHWTIHAIDIKAAYLQGDEINRELFLRPPSEFNEGKLWRLKKTVYGLCDAARAWYTRVKTELLKLSVAMCSLDPSLFYMQLDNKIVGIICVYVDDFLWAGTDYFRKNIVDKLYDLFLIGDEASASFRYVGLNISTDCSNNITIDQNMYASALLPVKISSERSANKSSALSDSEKDEYRAVIGQLNWLATQTRPDIAFETCDLSVSLKKATVNELLRLNKLVCRVKNTPLKIVFPQMSSIESCRLVGYADASFANLCEGKSQGGFIVFLVDSCGNHCPIIWQS